MSIEKMTLREIESLKRNVDYAEYLNFSDPIQDLPVSVSAFELSEYFSIRLSLVFGKDYFDRVQESPKEREQFIEELERFPKLRVFKNIDEQEYKVVGVSRHSAKILEVKLALDHVENVPLQDLPHRIRWVWSDIVDRLG
jgi:CRISPR/Cas system CMR subunit Cmr6 (Cas7 group RAMP superfamily)